MKREALNAICPYFTMFPLSFPNKVLDRISNSNLKTLDPFCGRGTTNFASRLQGYNTIGIDSNPVASAIASAKLVDSLPSDIFELAEEILLNLEDKEIEMPTGEFWDLAFEKSVLIDICKYRQYLLECKNTEDERALRGLILGALHGPTPKHKDSYFSNQCQRTYSPKPNYAVNYWKKNSLTPRKVRTTDIIFERALRYYEPMLPKVDSFIYSGDSRDSDIFHSHKSSVDVIITSPPYYGMTTYYQDQWLRNWFVGGADQPDYQFKTQVSHTSPEIFATELRKVWMNCEYAAKENAKAVIRYGGIHDRNVSSLDIIKESFKNTNWKIQTIKAAGHSENGKRQFNHIKKGEKKKSQMEYDVWLKLN